jgi:predicted flavoprotein YhiN
MLTQGSTGQAGITGHQGTSGPGAFQITDWKEELMRKYPQFTIKIEYEPMLNYIDPIHVVTDNRTNKQYKIKHTTNQSNIMNETEQFIQELIITIRDEKITQVINGH